MTDIHLDTDNDLLIQEGQIFLIGNQEELTRQRILNKLRAFTGTLFTNIDYGIKASLVFNVGTQNLLDQDIKTLITETKGVVKLVSYSSTVGHDRDYTSSFSYEIDTGEIVGVANVSVSASPFSQINKGIWVDGEWDYSGIWDDEEIWGEGIPPTPLPDFEMVYTSSHPDNDPIKPFLGVTNGSSTGTKVEGWSGIAWLNLAWQQGTWLSFDIDCSLLAVGVASALWFIPSGLVDLNTVGLASINFGNQTGTLSIFTNFDGAEALNTGLDITKPITIESDGTTVNVIHNGVTLVTSMSGKALMVLNTSDPSDFEILPSVASAYPYLGTSNTPFEELGE